MTIPYPFQREGVRAIRRFRGRALLADDMGLGKSFQALKYADRCVDGPVVIVCPMPVKYSWRHEASTHFGKRVAILNGTRPPQSGLRASKAAIFVINYDVLPAWVKTLRKIRPALVIIDECQAIKNIASKRCKAVRALCKGVRRVLALSGTPITNRPIEFWPVLNLLRPDVFGSQFDFGLKFCGLRRNDFGKFEAKGCTNPEGLNKLLLETCMIRRRLEDVLPELPPMRTKIIPITLTKSDRREYDRALNDFVNWLRSRGRVKALKSGKTQAMTKIGYLKQLVAEAKLRHVSRWIRRRTEKIGGKLVLFAYHKKILADLHERFGRESVKVDGSVVGEDREHAKNTFIGKRRVKYFFGQIRATGVGINGLQHASQEVAFAEFGWTPAEHAQAAARVRRLGQQYKSRAWYLMAEDTIEEKIVRMLITKQRNINSIMDGGPVARDTILEELLSELLATKGSRSCRKKKVSF